MTLAAKPDGEAIEILFHHSSFDHFSIRLPPQLMMAA